MKYQKVKTKGFKTETKSFKGRLRRAHRDIFNNITCKNSKSYRGIIEYNMDEFKDGMLLNINRL
jgi:hypothetical protein